MLGSLIKSVLGPELYRIYKQYGKQDIPGKNYQMNNLEYLSSSFITLFHGFCSICKWTSPVLLAFAYSRNYLTFDNLYSLCNMAFILGGILLTNYALRGWGRLVNQDYQLFIRKYYDIKNRKSITEKQKFLSEYDFELSNWIPEYIAETKPNSFYNEKHTFIHASIGSTLKYNTWRVLSYLCVDTFGLRMAYPGTILKSLIGKALIEGRSNFIEKRGAKRAIIKTACSKGNQIDTLLVDQRNPSRHPTNFNTSSNQNFSVDNGKTLVICCDGNASFYEVGCFSIPIEKGYSTLGWNYPGFGESSGLPYPTQLTSAADAVMQYAFSLGFKSENILLFSWSIGGFACSWLSNQYPETKGVILDACFDNITPLALQQMPKFASNFVEYTIKHTLNLNVAQLISNYNGPVIFIRRTEDEIISTIQRHPSSNRGNNLLLKTLNTRYPNIFNNETIPYIRTWLSAKSDTDRKRILSSYSTDDEQKSPGKFLLDYVKSNSLAYPINIGSDKDTIILSRDHKLTLAFFLADKYLLNFESTHCIPLPLEYFVEPWSENKIQQFYNYSF